MVARFQCPLSRKMVLNRIVRAASCLDIHEITAYGATRQSLCIAHIDGIKSADTLNGDTLGNQWMKLNVAACVQDAYPFFFD